MSLKKKHEEHEEHADETWLVPYADVLTLLLALFIVLFAMSKVDQQKFQQVADSLREAFSSQFGILTGQTTIQPIVSPPPSKPSEQSSQFDRETQQLEELKQKLDAFITENNLTTQLETQLTDDGLVIVIKDALFFRSGSAEILPQSEPVADSIAKMLTTIDQKVSVSGHTDNIPINTAEFPSNWDLSSKRAVNFMKYMLNQEPSLDPTRFSATGYGEYRPIAENSNDAGRAKNRRVELLIYRNYPKAID